MTTGGQFGTIDLNTGAATVLTANGVLPGGVPPAGLAQVGGTLYTAGYMNRTLYTVNPASGAVNSVGTTSIVFFALGSTSTGLYALGWPVGGDTHANPSLYSIDPRTAAVQQIGQNGQPGVSPGFYAWTLSTGSPTLYFADYGNLYSIDTNTGNATVIGTNGLVVQGLAYENGKLYAMSNSPGQVWTLDTSSGAATLSANVTGNNIPYLGAMAPITPPTTPQILSQVAFGGGWYTSLYFNNPSTSSVSFNVNFTADNGTSLVIPSIGGSSTTINLAPHATAILEAPNVGNLNRGYATIALPAGVTGYGVFRQTIAGIADQEAVVPLASSTSTGSTLVWDDTSYTTGVSIANPSISPVTVSITVWNSSGGVIATSSVPLAAGAKMAAFLRNIPGLSAVVGNRGSAQFTVSSGSVAVLGLRFNGFTFTSIPAAQQ
jgi:hypothetical protein